MVALLHPNSSPQSSGSHHPNRPQLRVIEGGRSVASHRGGLIDRQVEALWIDRLSVEQRHRVALGAAVAAVVMVLTLTIGLRMVQGGPPVTSLAPETNGAAADVALDVGVTRVVEAGDTWHSLATEVAPQMPTADAVRALTAANGGFALDTGAVIVIPDTLAP